MRRFIPRFFNVISFLLALLVFYPWERISMFMEWAYNKTNFSLFLSAQSFFKDYTGYRLFLIPCLLLFLSFVFFISALADKHKSQNKVTARPIENMAYAPLYYLGSAAALSGVMYYSTSLSLKLNSGFVILNNDYYGLGKFLSGIPFFSSGSIGDYAALIIFSVLLTLEIVLAFVIRRTAKRNFFGKFFTWLLFLILMFVSIKGLFLNYTDYGTVPEMLKSLTKDYVYVYKASEIDVLSRLELETEMIISGALIILYIIIGSIACAKNNRKYFKAQRTKENNEPKKDYSNYKSPFAQTEKIEDPVYSVTKSEESILPRTEQVIETETIEKVVTKDVKVEESDLDKIFSTSFNFKNCSMRKEGNVTDYYVNNTKFLTLSNANKTMSFRLELDKAIRIIIEYPLVGKDKYENHKIWFKVDDNTALPVEAIISIIKDAYDAALNNL